MTIQAPWALSDWPVGGPCRDHAVHVAYVRAVKRARGRLADYVSPSAVAKRDRWLCAACGQPVARSWDAIDGAPVLQLVVPLDERLRYTARSVRLAHFQCADFADRRLERDLRHALAGVPSVKTQASGTDTHCLSGHELAGANLLKASDGRRRCRKCRNDRESGQPAREGAGA